MFLLSTTHSGTDACARLHFASSRSFVSCAYGFLSCRFLLFTSLNNPSHCSRPFIRPLCLISPLLPPLQLHTVGLTASPFLLHPLNPLHSFFSSFLFICVYTLHSTTPLPPFLLLPLSSTPLADSFAVYSVKTSLEAPMDAQNYDDGCACFVGLLWVVTWLRYTFPVVCVVICGIGWCTNARQVESQQVLAAVLKFSLCSSNEGLRVGRTTAAPAGGLWKLIFQ